MLAKIRDEERGLLKKQIEDELRVFLLAKVRKEEKEGMKAEMEAELRTVIEKEMRESNKTQELIPRRERSTGRAANKKGKRAVISDGNVPREDSFIPEEEAEVEREGPDNIPREESVLPVLENDPDVPEVVVTEPAEGDVEQLRDISQENSIEHQNTAIDESPEINSASMEDPPIRGEVRSRSWWSRSPGRPEEKGGCSSEP